MCGFFKHPYTAKYIVTSITLHIKLKYSNYYRFNKEPSHSSFVGFKCFRLAHFNSQKTHCVCCLSKTCTFFVASLFFLLKQKTFAQTDILRKNLLLSIFLVDYNSHGLSLVCIKSKINIQKSKIAFSVWPYIIPAYIIYLIYNISYFLFTFLVCFFLPCFFLSVI